MAEVTSMRHNALPYPVYGTAWVVTFPILDADGDLVSGATGLDSEVSKNGDTFADCTNEATEIATNSGIYYLLLTSTEMTADVVSVIVKTTSSGAKTTVLTLYPRKGLPILRSGTVGANAADGTTIQLDSGASPLGDYYNGCLIVATLDSSVEARVISDYDGTTKVCTVGGPAFNTVPDNNDTFVIYLTELTQWQYADVYAFGGAGSTQNGGRPEVNVSHYGGSAGTFSGGRPEVNASHAAGTAWNSGSIGAATLAADTIGASELATDAVTEIVNAVWAAAARTLTTLDEDSTTLDLDATIRGAIGMASNNLDAQLTTLSNYIDTEVAAILAAVDTEVAAIKAKTDNLPSDPADASDIAGSFTTVNTKLDTIDDFLDTEIAAIKAKTDNLPSDPSDASVIAGRFDTIDGNIQDIEDAIAAFSGGVTPAQIADAVHDEVIEGSTSMRQLMRGMSAVLLGKATGLNANAPVYRDIDDTKDRVVAITDIYGNRTSVTLDLS